MLVINEQITTEILKNGLKLEETLAEINELIKKYEIVEDVNHINITYHNKDTKETSIYLVNHDPKNNTFDYLEKNYNKDNNGAWHPFKIKTIRETNCKKMLTSLILNRCNSADFIKSGKPRTGYKIKEIENGKPNTLLKAKNKDLICFVACIDPFSDGTPAQAEFLITDTKDTYKSNFLNISYSWKDCDRARKDANAIFAVYNSKLGEYNKKQETIKRKRIERANHKHIILQQKKYLYVDKDYFAFLRDYNGCVRWWGISQNGLDEKWDNIDFDYIEYKNRRYYHGCKTRKELYNKLFDKNGFFKLPYIISLKDRTEELKREKERQQAEENRQKWQTSDHTHQEQYINSNLQNIKNIIVSFFYFDIFMKDYAIKKLDIFKEIYKDFEKLKNYNKYADVNEWNKAKEETESKYNFYLTALNRGALDKKLACMHQYEKTETGYKMTSKYINDPFYKNYDYVLEF